MNILPVIKFGAGVVTSLGAGAVVGNAIKFTTPVLTKKSSKILVGIGSVVLATVAGEVTGNYVENSIQHMADSWKAGKKFGESYARARSAFTDPNEDVYEAPADTVDGGEYVQVHDDTPDNPQY